MSELSPATVEALGLIRRMGRRDFLRAGVAAATLAAVAGGGMLMPQSARAALPKGISVMSPSEYAVFKRLMEVMLPVEGSALMPLADVPVMQTLDAALLATMAPNILKGLKGGVSYFDEAPVARYGKRFSQLTDADATRFCDDWANAPEAPHRALVMGLKKLVGLAYWANPPTWGALGYDGPVTRKWGLQSLGNAPMPRS